MTSRNVLFLLLLVFIIDHCLADILITEVNPHIKCNTCFVRDLLAGFSSSVRRSSWRSKKMEPGFSNQFALPFAEIFLHRCTPHFSLVKHHFKISEPDKRQGRRLPLGKGKSATDFNVLKISQDQADKGGSALPLEVSLVRNSSELLSLATIWSFTCSISFQITRAGAGSKLKAKKVERCPYWLLTSEVCGAREGTPARGRRRTACSIVCSTTCSTDCSTATPSETPLAFLHLIVWYVLVLVERNVKEKNYLVSLFYFINRNEFFNICVKYQYKYYSLYHYVTVSPSQISSLWFWTN